VPSTSSVKISSSRFHISGAPSHRRWTLSRGRLRRSVTRRRPSPRPAPSRRPAASGRSGSYAARCRRRRAASPCRSTPCESSARPAVSRRPSLPARQPRFARRRVETDVASRGPPTGGTAVSPRPEAAAEVSPGRAERSGDQGQQGQPSCRECVHYRLEHVDALPMAARLPRKFGPTRAARKAVDPPIMLRCDCVVVSYLT
jgi:hypothetical protein